MRKTLDGADLGDCITGTFFMDRRVAAGLCALMNGGLNPPVFVVCEVHVSGVTVLAEQPEPMDSEFIKELAETLPLNAVSCLIPEDEREVVTWHEQLAEWMDGSGDDE